MNCLRDVNVILCIYCVKTRKNDIYVIRTLMYRAVITDILKIHVMYTVVSLHLFLEIKHYVSSNVVMCKSLF